MLSGYSNKVTFAFVIITLNICLFIFRSGEWICMDSEIVKDYGAQLVQQEHQINDTQQHFDTQEGQNVV